MVNGELMVEKHIASKKLRFANNLIDLVFLCLFNLVLTQIVDLIYEYYDHDILYNFNYGGFWYDMFWGTIVSAIYFFLFEYYIDGRTFGKYCTGTAAVMKDGSLPNSKNYIIRTLARSIPFEAFSFLGNYGWHDSWSDTRVVKIKDYEAALKLEKDMEILGTPEIV